ncbi:MAG: hypothetical protein RMJ44_03895 [Cytophagales bacterium]|nr:hypothetical protein [Bernardetiaceae bacterium]MDW8210205.1 hypothetical protein [Cytophagales bacterium]
MTNHVVIFLAVMALLTCRTHAQINQKLIRELLPGKRWALALYIADTPLGRDTILRVHDCANEFLEVLPNGSFISSNLRKPGTWQIIDDSTVLFKKSSGATIMTARISYLSPDSLVIIDFVKNKDIFIQTFNLCRPNDVTFEDSRPEFTILETWSLVAGGQYFQSGLADIGIARGELTTWNKILYSYGAHLELAPWNSIYGLIANGWLEDKRFFYGGAVGTYYDVKNIFPFFRPSLGITAKQFMPEGYSLHLAYGYNFIIGQKRNSNINLHHISIRLRIPFSRQERKVRRLPTQEYEGQ